MKSVNMYDIGTYVAEIYDQNENYIDDVLLIKKHLNNKKINILEPFCGTGRISLPFAEEGHEVVGIDNAKGMLALYAKKVRNRNVPSNKVKLINRDVLNYKWPEKFDLVILGGNCFYELATKEEQELCIKKAYNSLNNGGYIYIDNNHMEGDLDPSWQQKGIVRKSLCGITDDGSTVETTMETIWYDVKKRLAKFKRRGKVIKSNGEIIESQYIQQKHPVSAYEVQLWLKKYNFDIIKKYGDRKGGPYSNDSPRAIFWGRKQLKGQARDGSLY